MTNKINKVIHNGTEFEFESVNGGVTSVNGDTGAVTVNDVKKSATEPSSPTEGMVWYDTTNDQLKVYDGTSWGEIGGGTEYTAGKGIEILEKYDYSAMQGPCDPGFHIPSTEEFGTLKTIWTNLGGGETDGTNFGSALKIPFAGYIRDTGVIISRGSSGGYWTNQNYITSPYFNSMAISVSSTYINTNNNFYKTYGLQIRPFRDNPVIPDNNWTKLYGTSIEAGGIFWSSAQGLISLSSDGINWITIADKNLGATVAWNSGDTLSADNCGGYFQWGNNYMFPYSLKMKKMARNDANLYIGENYGPGNYFSNDVFITSAPWNLLRNDNLRGGQTGVIQKNNMISGNAKNGVGFIKKADYSAIQGPCNKGFHVPTQEELDNLSTIISYLESKYIGSADNMTKLSERLKIAKMQITGYIEYSSGTYSAGVSVKYLSSTPYVGGSSRTNVKAYALTSNTNNFSWGVVDTQSAYGGSIRPFYNTSIKPNSNWIKLCGRKIEEGGSFWNQNLGLISLSIDGEYWITISDKNLGATEVYNEGDSVTDANSGYLYQWGNNYGFSRSGTITTSSTQVDATGYGPGNYYSSSTFITGNPGWESSNNLSLRGRNSFNYGINGELDKYFTNTGVRSINGKTGDVIISNNAGQGIKIGDDYSAKQGPCDPGFHIPTKKNLSDLIAIGTNMGIWSSSSGTNFGKYLKMPFTGYEKYNGGFSDVGSRGVYSSCEAAYSEAIYVLTFTSSSVGIYNTSYNNYPTKGAGISIRPFKDDPVVPDSSWTIIYDGSNYNIGSGIFHNPTLGLISASSDGSNWITIADKNLGATTVRNDGDALSESNGGKRFQRGNNYGFPFDSNPSSTSTTKVNVNGYGPGNYYSSSTFIKANPWYNNAGTLNNLRGGQDPVIYNAIINTGFLPHPKLLGSVGSSGGVIDLTGYNWFAIVLNGSNIGIRPDVYYIYKDWFNLGSTSLNTYNVFVFQKTNTTRDLYGYYWGTSLSAMTFKANTSGDILYVYGLS